MADYTISTSANEERALTFILARVNANRAAESPSREAITAAQLLDGVVRQELTRAWRDLQADEQDRVRLAYAAANATTQNQIKSALGLS